MAKDKKGPSLVTLLPIVFFVGLTVLFLVSLTTSKDRQNIPSVLIGKPLPQISLEALDGAQRDGVKIPALKTSDLINPEINKGRVMLINIWASWCAPCRQEHPFLMALAGRPDVMIVGVNYKDQNSQALKFLKNLGNPFDVIGVDPDGRTAIELGVYGVPETFIVSSEGQILFKHVGPILSESEQKKILQAITQGHQKRSDLKNSDQKNEGVNPLKMLSGENRTG